MHGPSGPLHPAAEISPPPADAAEPVPKEASLDMILNIPREVAPWFHSPGFAPARLAGLDLSEKWIAEAVNHYQIDVDSLEMPFRDNSETISLMPEVGPRGPRWLNADNPSTLIGSIYRGSGPDLFMFQPETDAFQIKFTAFDATSDLADTLVLLDQNAGLIANVTVTRTDNTVTIDVCTKDLEPGEAIYLQVGTPETQTSATREDYALTVIPTGSGGYGTGNDFGSADSNSGPSTTLEKGPSLAQPSRPDSGTGDSAASFEELPDATWAPLPPAVGEIDRTSGRAEFITGNGKGTVVGPLPARSAAPFGGILGFGDPTPAVGLHEASVLDLALIDLQRADLTKASDTAPDDELTGEPVALQEEGILPVMAALHPRANAAGAQSEAADDTVPMIDQAPEIIPTLIATTNAELTREGGEPILIEAVPLSPTRQVMRWAVAGLTALMALHLLMPDLGLVLPYVRVRSWSRRRLQGDFVPEAQPRI